MDRVFLDANVLYAAARGPGSRLRRLWLLENIELLSSTYAVEEARRNLEVPAQRGRLTRLTRRIRLVEAVHFTLPRGITLPDKDLPFLLAAIDGGATHLLTGDRQHLGSHYGRWIGGVLILPPAEYPQVVQSE